MLVPSCGFSLELGRISKGVSSNLFTRDRVPAVRALEAETRKEAKAMGDGSDFMCSKYVGPGYLVIGVVPAPGV